MTWFDKSGQRKVKPAAFPDRSPQKKPDPAWIAEHNPRPSSLSTWLSSRPAPPPAVAGAIPVVVPTAPLMPRTRASQPPPRPAPPAPPPRHHTSPPPAPAVQVGSTDAIEAKSLSLEQRESMMPRTSAPPPDLLGTRGPESADFSAMQAIYQAKLEESLSVFERGVEELINARAHILEASEDTIVRLAAAIARRVIGREVTTDPDLMLTLAAEGAEALGERDRVVVRFAPFEREDLWQALEERVRRRIPRCQVIQDPTLSAGQCIVESELGQVDESVDKRLATVLEAILPRASHRDE